MPNEWFQKLFYKETILAIKSSLNFLCYERFKNDLVLLLPQESQKSKLRIANNILHRFFPDKKVYQFLPQVWQAYQDEILLQEIIRFELLTQEPVVAKFYLKEIYGAETGQKLSSNTFAEYIEENYNKKEENLVCWLQGIMRDLGFIKKETHLWEINKNRIPETAFILLLHKIHLPYPSELTLEHIISNNFWQLIGIKDKESIKNILYKADLLNLLSFDGDKIKTFYTLENLLIIKPDLN